MIIEFFEGILSALYKAVRKKNTKKKKGQTKNRNSVNSKRVDYRKNKPVTTKPTTHQENKNIITSKNNRNNDKIKDNTKPEEIISTDISATISSNPQISEKNVDIIAPEIIETNKTVLPNITGKGAVNQNETYTKPVETVESTESLVVTPDSTEEGMASNNTEESDSNDGSVLSDKTGNGEIDEEESNTEPVVTVSETVEPTESIAETTNNIKSVSSHSETDSYLELESDFINQLIEADHSDNAGKLEKTNNISVVYKQDTSKRSYNKSQVTDKQLKERDKRFKKWTKSVSEMDGSDDSLLNTIIKQIKDLQNEYGSNYPLGFITLTDQEYKKLLLLCRKILLNSDVMISQYNALILTVTLVQFTIRRNDNEDFWNRFFYIIQVDDNSVFRRIFYEAIISFCVSEGLFFYYLNGKRRYIETIKIHS